MRRMTFLVPFLLVLPVSISWGDDPMAPVVLAPTVEVETKLVVPRELPNLSQLLALYHTNPSDPDSLKNFLRRTLAPGWSTPEVCPNGANPIYDETTGQLLRVEVLGSLDDVPTTFNLNLTNGSLVLSISQSDQTGEWRVLHTDTYQIMLEEGVARSFATDHRLDFVLVANKVCLCDDHAGTFKCTNLGCQQLETCTRWHNCAEELPRDHIVRS